MVTGYVSVCNDDGTLGNTPFVLFVISGLVNLETHIKSLKSHESSMIADTSSDLTQGS